MILGQVASSCKQLVASESFSPQTIAAHGSGSDPSGSLGASATPAGARSGEELEGQGSWWEKVMII